jgi:hypothetical protein
VEEAVTNMKVGFGSALKNYATSEHDVLVAATKMIDSRLSQGFPNQGLAILASCAEYLTPPDFSTALGSIDSFDPNLPAISVLRLNKGLTELLDTLNTMILEEV